MEFLPSVNVELSVAEHAIRLAGVGGLKRNTCTPV
jgi:hypothetical protein